MQRLQQSTSVDQGKQDRPATSTVLGTIQKELFFSGETQQSIVYLQGDLVLARFLWTRAMKKHGANPKPLISEFFMLLKKSNDCPRRKERVEMAAIKKINIRYVPAHLAHKKNHA